MGDSVEELHQSLFGGLHDFHIERTTAWLKAVHEELGDDVLKVIEEKGVDIYGLYRWHLERTLSWIDALTEVYGSDVVNIIIEKHRADRREQGAQLAKNLEKNSLDDIVPFFSHGNEENIIEKNDKYVLIKTTGCLAGKVACDINRAEMVYALHCALDEDFTEGFNNQLGCEVIQTLMEGYDCCIHKIYVKD